MEKKKTIDHSKKKRKSSTSRRKKSKDSRSFKKTQKKTKTQEKKKEAIAKGVKKQRKKGNLLFMLLMIIGVGVLCYPIISNGYYQWIQRQSSAEYRQQMQNQISAKKIKKEMAEYNHELANQKGQDIVMPFTDEQKLSENKEHSHELGEVLGIIAIPKIRVELPIYHGTNEKQLLYGAGLLRGTSMPTGGESTHAVITGHRGLPSAKLFTDLPKLEEKDLFYIELADEILAYEVDQIKVVEPENMQDLEIIPNQDYVTLLTCTPYMVNTHRLLVRGHRIPYEEKQRKQLLEQGNRRFWIECLLYAFGASLVIFWLVWQRRRRKRGKS